MSEDPKTVLRKAAEAERQRKLSERSKRLSEDRPDEIEAWCNRALKLTPLEAAWMTGPLAKLDYDRMDDRVVTLVESTLRWAMLGERPVAPHREG